MKNTIKVFGLIALLAIIGFSAAACKDDSGSGGSGLTGTRWMYTISGPGGVYTATLNFTASGYTFQDNQGSYWTGTYTFNGKTGTMTSDSGEIDQFEVNGSRLTLTSGGESVVFDKQG